MKGKIIKNLLKIFSLVFFLISLIGCSKGGNLISGPSTSSQQIASQNNDPNGVPCSQDGTNDPSGVPGGQDGTNDPNGVPGGQDGTNDPNSVPGGQDGSTDPNGVPGGSDGTNDPNNSNETTYQFSITQSAHEQREVDILMVIDNSGSMSDNHKNLGKRFGHLFNDDLQRVDWQMAFISSCFGIGGYSKDFYNLKGLSDNTHQILSSQFENSEDIFLNTISSKQHGGCSTSELQGVLNMINSPRKHPEGFFRTGALLAIVIVTDDTDITGVVSSDIVTAVKDTFGQFKLFTAYGLIVEPGDVRCDNKEPQVNYKVDELARKTGGITGSICANDYSPIMTDIGNHIEKTLSYSEVLLRHTNIIENTISLSCSLSQNTTECPDWEFDSISNKIIFETPPEEGVTVQISYNYQI